MARRNRRKVKVVLPNVNTPLVRAARRQRGSSRSRSRSRSRSQVRTRTSVNPTARAMFAPRTTFDEFDESTLAGVQPNMRFSEGRVSRGRTGKANIGVPPLVEATIDPWSPCAQGLRYPDDFRGLSGTFSANFESLLPTGQAAGTYTDLNMVGITPTPGSGLWLVTPDPSNVLVQGVVGTSGVFGAQAFSWPNGILFTGAKDSLNAFGPGSGVINVDYPIGNLNTLRSLYNGCRLVTGAVKLTGTLNFSTVSGTVHVAPVFVDYSKMTILPGYYPQDPAGGEYTNGWQTVLPSSLTQMIDLPGYKEYPMASLQTDEIVAIFKRYGEEALLFKPTQSAWGMEDDAAGALAERYGTLNVPNSTGHYCILVAVSNVVTSSGGNIGAGTNIIELEVKLNYECQANPATGTGSNFSYSAGFATPAPPHQPILMAAFDNITSDIPVVRNVDDAGVEEASFIDEVVRLWKSSVKIAGSVVAAVDVVGGILGAFAL